MRLFSLRKLVFSGCFGRLWCKGEVAGDDGEMQRFVRPRSDIRIERRDVKAKTAQFGTLNCVDAAKNL